MESLLCRTVEMRICNWSHSIILRNPRTYFESGTVSRPPMPQLRPDSCDSPHFQGTLPFWGVAGVLVYEADSFTLAIYFSNPIDYTRFSIEVGLELSLSKAHTGRLAEIYARMSKGTYSSSFVDAKFNRVTVDESHRTVQVSDGPVRVTATMYNEKTSILKVELEELCWNKRRSQN